MAEQSEAYRLRAEALAACSNLTEKAEAVREAMAQVNTALIAALEKFRLASEATWTEMDAARGYAPKPPAEAAQAGVDKG